MSDIQEKITGLRAKGWTLSAISDELEVHRETVYGWSSGKFYPDHAKLVLMGLDGLLERKRIPKRRRHAPGEHHTQRKSQQAED